MHYKAYKNFYFSNALNLETVKTYEGAENIHSLVLGKNQTGLSSF